MTEIEQQALVQAGRVAGGYLETIEKTDLAELSDEEWAIFLEAVVETYGEKVRELAGGPAPEIPA